MYYAMKNKWNVTGLMSLELANVTKISIFPANNTINRHMGGYNFKKESIESMPGGACSNGDFRPWRLSNGTTLGY
jgi:hypothetical protein